MKKDRKLWKMLRMILLVCDLTLLPAAAASASEQLPANENAGTKEISSENGIARAEIPVSVQVVDYTDSKEANVPEEVYQIKLTALDGAPVPADAELKLTGTSSSAFTIEYDRPGIYHYSAALDTSALNGADTAGQYNVHYDTTVYYITVSVLRTEEGTIGTTVSAHKGSENGEKTDLIFTNTYDPIPQTPTELSTEPTTENPPKTPSANPPGNNSPKGSSPKTGDQTPIEMYVVVMVGAAVVLVFLGRRNKKQK